MKVGQKCRIETTEKITGREIYGSGWEYIEINENCVEITGKSVGKINGYIYIGETKKSFFITIEENAEDTTLDTITLNIDTTSEQDENTDINSNNKNNISNDNTIAETILPKAGLRGVIYIVIFFVIGSIIISSIKLKKYKKIKM